ncbi:unnamed protein product [Citrullus colocynthis]|uniref:Uncharacterized protein n=1 Tax=Citrullus colocynthis TaxID=252529 RepID=A0ABP0Y8P9_9ROSI
MFQILLELDQQQSLFFIFYFLIFEKKREPQTNFFLNSRIHFCAKLKNTRRESNFLGPLPQVVAPPLAGEIKFVSSIPTSLYTVPKSL